MDNPFDDYHDDEFDEFEDREMTDEFDDEAHLFEPQNVEVALMNKGELIALIGVITSATGGVLTRLDPRNNPPVATSRCDSPDKARRLFGKSIRSSVANGWQVFYKGVPLEG